MEYLEGETLATRFARGPLPLAQALEIGAQIADALAAAHRHGVVHRDLKPGNVMLTTGGAKLLDFGLAKLKAGSGLWALGSGETSAPGVTTSEPLTGRGVIVGTLPYMAPEQIEGKSVDARTDLWALGTILYEMLTGKPAFEGDTSASLIGAILEREPEPLAERGGVMPPALGRLVRKCLAKTPDDRWDSAHDVADELRWISQASTMAAVPIPLPRRRALTTPLVVTGVFAAAMTGAGVTWLLRPPAPNAPLAHVNLDVRPADELNAGWSHTVAVPTPGGARTALTWTPDGQALVFVGRRGGVQQLYVRRLDASEARALSGTEDAQVPAVSPDGRWVAFWAGGALKKLPFDGGPVMDVASGIEFPPSGLVWDAGGNLFFGTEEKGIWEVGVEGAVRAITTLGEAEWAHGLPCALPGGQALLFTVRKSTFTWGREEIVAHTLATGKRKVLLQDAADARYLPTGHLVFLRRGVLFGVAFDARRLEVRGTPVALLDPVAQALTAGDTRDLTGAGQFAISGTGTLAWVPGRAAPYPQSALVTVERRGEVWNLSAPLRNYDPFLRVSPDGRRLAVMIRSLTDLGLWLFDLGRDDVLTPLVREGEVHWLVWSPDGQRLLFNWLNDGRYSLAAQTADRSRPPKVLARLDSDVSSVTPDGLQLATVSGGVSTSVMIVTLGQGEATVKPWHETTQTELHPEFSPDGRWLAYTSNVSGRGEVYLRPYPGPGAVVLVSVDGGSNPAWHPNGRELFFVDLPDPADKRRMMAVDVELGTPPRIGRPRALFEFDSNNLRFGCIPVRCYDVAPDGQRFYVVQAVASPPPPVVTRIDLVLNWFEELKAKVGG